MAKTKKVPHRMCVGCKEMKNKKDLIRIVRTPDDNFIVDKTGKKSGRGAYICDDINCFNSGIKTKGLERSFKQKIPENVLEDIKNAIGVKNNEQ